MKRQGSIANRTVQKAQMLRLGGQLFFDFLSASWRARAGLLRLLPQGQPHLLSLVKSKSLSAVRLLAATVKSKIAVTAEDMAVLNSETERPTPDTFVGPLPGVLPGFISYQCLAFWG
jgi:hypothetical protein